MVGIYVVVEVEEKGELEKLKLREVEENKVYEGGSGRDGKEVKEGQVCEKRQVGECQNEN